MSFLELLKKLLNIRDEKGPKLVVKGDPVVPSWKFFNATDPSVAKINNQWTMFFTAMDANNRLHILSATKPVGEVLNEKNWTVNETPILSPSENGWDSDAVETCSYIEAAGEQRLYFTGWTRPKEENGKCNYAIGMAKKVNGKWVKLEEPVLKPENAWEISPYGSILGDQAIVHLGIWVMYYQVGTNDNKTATVMAVSQDGINWLPENRTIVDFAPSTATSNLPNGPYHLDAKRINGKVCLIGWLPNEDLNKQGIWFVSGNSILKEGVDSNFSNWKLLLSETFGPDWFAPKDTSLQKRHENGLFGSCLVQEGEDYWLFFHTVTRTSDGTNNVGNIGCIKLDAGVI